MVKQHKTYECKDTPSGKSCEKVSSKPAPKNTVTFREK